MAASAGRSVAARARAVALAAAVAALPSGGPATAAAPGDPTAALDRALTAASGALEANEPESAESRYRTALLEGWLLLGALAAQRGDLEGAAAAFESGATAVADDRRARLAGALVEIEAGNPSEAAVMLRRLAARDPADVEVRQALARALAAAGSLAEAIQELEEVRVLAPDRLEVLYSLATAYLRQDRPEKAEPLLEELAAERPGPETWVLIGRTWRDHGHYPRARTALETALRLNPEQPRANYYLGSVELLAEGRARVDEAMARFRAELEVVPDDPVANLYLGIGLVETRRHEEALRPLEAARRSPLFELDASHFLGRVYLALDRAEEAVAALGRALELSTREAAEPRTGDADESRQSSIHYQLALALRRTGDAETAATHFELAKKYSARLAESSRDFLTAYLSERRDDAPVESAGPALDFPALAGLEDAAREALERRVRGLVARAYFDLGIFKARDGRFDGAARLLTEAAELAPDFPRLDYSLGVALFNAERFDAASVSLERALSKSPGDADVRRMLALAHLNSERYESALELLRDDPERAANRSLQYAYGVALVRSGRAAEAAPVFDELLREHADWADLHVVVGQAHAQEGDYEGAIRSMQRALELDPRVAEAHSTLGDIYLRRGELDEAETALERELATHPQDERARYTLAMVLDLNRKQAEAKQVLREHLDARPRSADGRYLLGKILLAEGAAEDALEQLRLAAELAPADPNVRYQLAQALQKLGRREEAAREFEAFRQLKQAERERPGP